MRKLIFALLLPLLFACTAPNDSQSDEIDKGAAEPPCVVAADRDPEAFCTQQYDPVCGCNDQTYGNACMARIDGVQRWTPGKCGEPPPEL